MAPPPLVARIGSLPGELGPALASRRQTMATQATGRVLELGDWTDHLDAYRIDAEVASLTRAREPSELEEPGPFDTIMSLVRTPLVADLGGYVDALLDVLAAKGRIGFLEPVIGTRSRRRRLRSLGGRLGGGRTDGLHLDRDLPRDLRQQGLIVTDLHRFDVRSVPGAFRSFVEAWARRPVAP